MQVSVKSSGITHLIGALAVLWLGTGTAWAGGGGADVASVQGALDSLCSALGMTSSCPQLPTLTQIFLEIAGLENAPPEDVRFQNAKSPVAALNAVNPPAGSSFELSNVSPLAFVPSTTSAVATVTSPGDPDAKSFFYAATNGDAETPPNLLNLVYDFLLLTKTSCAKGQFVADISIPLVVLKNGTESDQPVTIEIRGTGSAAGPCVSATAVGNFGHADAGSLGLTVMLAFQSSPNSSTPHAVFSVQAPLLVTHANDPAYFPTDAAAQAQFIRPAFVIDEFGFAPQFLGGAPVGIAPVAGPQCPGKPGATCPSPPPPSNYSLCASIADDTGTVRHAVAAFYSIGTVGTTYVASLVTPSGVSCPF